MKTFLIFDVSYLAWRSFHSTGHLSHNGSPTGTVFGFLKSVQDLQKQFMTDRCVFCFDSSPSLREQLVEKYKSTRKEQAKKDDEETRAAKTKMRKQIELLKLKYLKKIGYRNVFHQDGYEGDDLIAVAAKAVRDAGGRAVIVTGDKDMYQLLDENVLVYHPREQKAVTAKSFCRQYGVTPTAWRFVKAIGGCTTDDIPGVPGCREKTALAYLTGKLKKADARYKAIRSGDGRSVVRRNLKLVSLPMEGCKPVRLVKDGLNENGFRALCDSLGFASMSPRPRAGFRV